MRTKLMTLAIVFVALLSVAATVVNNRVKPIWNNAADTFTAWEVDATNTASAANSLVLDLQVDDTSVASVDKDGDMLVTGTLGVTGASTFTALVVGNNGIQDHSNEAITATVGGGTTGLITQGIGFATVTCDTATKQISLPAASVGDEICVLADPNTACELISAVAGHKVNNVVVGATNELALVAGSLYRCKYVATNEWIVRGFTNLGADEAALVPDAL